MSHKQSTRHVVDEQRYRRFSDRNIAFNAVSRDLGQPWHIGFGAKRVALRREGKASIKEALKHPSDAQIMYAYSKALGRLDVVSATWGRGHGNRDWLLWEPGKDRADTDFGRITDASTLTREVKRIAQLSGASRVGVARVNPQWFYSDTQNAFASAQDVDSMPIQFADVADIEEKNGVFLFPKSMQHVIAIAVPMNQAMIATAPSLLAEAATSQGYSLATHIGINVAGFIRNMGYHAAASLNGTALSIPIAIDAGLGELGRHGLLITPDHGPCVRLCKVFTDMPLVPDHPIHLGIRAYCETCQACATHCPSGAISKGQRNMRGHNECNNAGVLKWQVNAKKCLRYWVSSGTSCSACIAHCPFTLGRRWGWGLPQAIIRQTSLFNRPIAWLDRLFEQHKTHSSDTILDEKLLPLAHQRAQ